MKRITGLVLNTLLVFSLFVPFTAQALAPVESKPADFSAGCLISNNTKTFSGADTSEAPNSGGQRFRPTKSRLTTVTFYMEYSAINKVKMMLFKAEPWTHVKSSPTFAVTNETGYSAWQNYTVKYNFNVDVDTSKDYVALLYVEEGTANWRYIENDGSCDPGRSQVNLLNSLTTDMTFMVQGYNPVATTPTTTTKTTTTTTPAKTTAAAPVVAPNKLAVPLNFRVDNNGDNQIVFAWDKNKEADLAGYVLYVYEAQKEVETEIIDINDKELDNYNLDLAGHPKLSKDKEYDVKLAAKNTAGAVSEKTLSLRVKFEQPAAEVVVQDAKTPWFQNPYIWGGLGFLLVALLGLLFFMERKFHGISKLFNQKQK